MSHCDTVLFWQHGPAPHSSTQAEGTGVLPHNDVLIYVYESHPVAFRSVLLHAPLINIQLVRFLPITFECQEPVVDKILKLLYKSFGGWIGVLC